MTTTQTVLRESTFVALQGKCAFPADTLRKAYGRGFQIFFDASDVDIETIREAIKAHVKGLTLPSQNAAAKSLLTDHERLGKLLAGETVRTAKAVEVEAFAQVSDEFGPLIPAGTKVTTTANVIYKAEITATSNSVNAARDWKCGAKYSGNRAHCPTCHLTFGGVAGFDAHRVGGNCMGVSQIAAQLNLTPNRFGVLTGTYGEAE